MSAETKSEYPDMGNVNASQLKLIADFIGLSEEHARAVVGILLACGYYVEKPVTADGSRNEKAKEVAIDFADFVGHIKSYFEPRMPVPEDILYGIAKVEKSIAECDLLPPEMRRLIIAARVVAYESDLHPTDESRIELDKAVEAFADAVPWEDEPDHCPDTADMFP